MTTRICDLMRPVPWATVLMLCGPALVVPACGEDDAGSPTAPETRPALPATPTGLQVTGRGPDFIEWSWTPVPNASGYDIQLSWDEDFSEDDEIAARTAEQLTYRRDGLAPQATAHLRVRSARGAGANRVTSSWSDHVGGTTELPPGIVLAVDFDTTPLGEYTRAAFDSEWPSREWVFGLGRGFAEVVEGASAYSGRSLRLSFPAGTFGTAQHSFKAQVEFPRSYDELYLSYRVRFEEDFDFVLGGKLPGFYGGEGNAGGDKPDGSDGWSGRMMWRPGGAAVQYIYHPDQPDIYGEDFRYGRTFQPGIWHTVEHRFVMNTPRMHDGVVQTWFDGEEALHVEGLRFRDVDTFAIDGLRLAFFFGGSNSSWATTKDEYIYVDDFIVSTEPIRQ